MPKNILTCFIIGKQIKQLLILLASYAVFIIGILGYYFFDNCEQAGAFAFIAICALICFFVYLIILNVSTFKDIFFHSEMNPSPTLKTLSVCLILSVILLFSSWYGGKYLIIRSGFEISPDSIIIFVFTAILFFFLCASISSFMLFLAKLANTIYLHITHKCLPH
ncbi:hypothetical protein [Snodgrassella alvi]|uniref:hypothetical protein n=1 Tax=Snodgrassella alvi TaxID=1196083 RepID=UPI00345F86B4